MQLPCQTWISASARLSSGKGGHFCPVRAALFGFSPGVRLLEVAVFSLCFCFSFRFDAAASNAESNAEDSRAIEANFAASAATETTKSTGTPSSSITLFENGKLITGKLETAPHDERPEERPEIKLDAGSPAGGVIQGWLTWLDAPLFSVPKKEQKKEEKKASRGKEISRIPEASIVSSLALGLGVLWSLNHWRRRHSQWGA